MKKVTQNGRTITSLDELEDNLLVRVRTIYTVEDLPYGIEISMGVAVHREAWCNMVREFAREQEIAAIKWVRQLMKWGLKEAKFFVDELLEEKPSSDWFSVDNELPRPSKFILMIDHLGYGYIGVFEFGQWFETSNNEKYKITDITWWKYCSRP